MGGSGISLTFDDDGQVEIDESNRERNRCLGGVDCEHCTHENVRIEHDNRTYDGLKITCQSPHADTEIRPFMMKNCPEGRWITLDPPLGALERAFSKSWYAKYGHPERFGPDID